MKQQSMTVTRALNANQSNPQTSQTSGTSAPGVNPNDDDSKEGDPPKTFTGSGKRVIKTMKKIATSRGVGLINGFSGFLKNTNGAANFFGNFLREQSNNVKDVAKESLGMVSSFGNSSTRGAKNVLNSARTIGAQGAEELNSAMKQMTKLGTNLTRLGGSAIRGPIAMGGEAANIANRVVKIPVTITKKISNGAIKPFLSLMGAKSDDDDGDDDDDDDEDVKKPADDPTKSSVNPSNKKSTI